MWHISSVFVPCPINDTCYQPYSVLYSLMKCIGVKVRSPFSNILSLLVQENFQENSTALIYTFVHIKMKQQCLILCPKSWMGRVSGGSNLADLKYLDVMLSKLCILAVKAFLWLCENPENSNRKNTIFLIFTPTESLNFSCKIYLNSLKSSNFFFSFSYRGL